MPSLIITIPLFHNNNAFLLMSPNLLHHVVARYITTPLHTHTHLDERVYAVLRIKKVPDSTIELFDAGSGFSIKLLVAFEKISSKECVRHNHDRLPEMMSGGKGGVQDGRDVIGPQHQRGILRDLPHPQPRGKGGDAVLLVPRDVRQVLGDGDHHRKDRHEPGKEDHRGVPPEGDAQGLLDGVVHAEVEQEAADAGDGQAGQQRVALELEGRHAVQAADQQAKGVEPQDHRPKAPGDDEGAQGGGARHHGPGRALAQLPRRDRQEGLVHLVDVHVVDLVDAHDVRVPHE
mmetsp:Transcript_23476/g.32517  ORF Transcript_23476/g.32517 Transcript_23476/m.32517 type:complete len:289 (-) Transcript_23476:224-1090(-)